jgi:hypothetical protein
MVMNKKEHTPKTPAKQGADEVIPKEHVNEIRDMEDFFLGEILGITRLLGEE